MLAMPQSGGPVRPLVYCKTLVHRDHETRGPGDPACPAGSLRTAYICLQPVIQPMIAVAGFALSLLFQFDFPLPGALEFRLLRSLPFLGFAALA